MRRLSQRLMMFSCLFAAWVNAGSLYIDVSSAAASPEAQNLHASLVARVTACHEPAKSVVTASLIRMDRGRTERTPLQVIALKTPGSYAVVGSVAGGVLDVAVTNPQFPNFQPHVLVRGGEKEVQLAGAKHFSNIAPTEDDFRSLVQQ